MLVSMDTQGDSVKDYPSWLPGSGFRQKVKEAKRYVDQLRNVPYGEVKQQMVRTFSGERSYS